MAVADRADDFPSILRRVRLGLLAAQRALRDAEPWQILICAIFGSLIGAAVDLLREGVAWLHVYDFGIPSDHYLSEGIGVRTSRLLIVPLLGGLILGALALLMKRRFGDIVDPIEANALHGGRMSLRDSLWLTFMTVISNGAGASLGMEAGYSQLGGGFYSWLGRKLRLRRADLRIFVTAGAGAAIAAAFNAPLAGAFYGPSGAFAARICPIGSGPRWAAPRSRRWRCMRRKYWAAAMAQCSCISIPALR
jgi:CIC family chloride channel protein